MKKFQASDEYRSTFSLNESQKNIANDAVGELIFIIELVRKIEGMELSRLEDDHPRLLSKLDMLVDAVRRAKAKIGRL